MKRKKTKYTQSSSSAASDVYKRQGWRSPFTKSVALTGKAFADDKRYVACSREGMQQRFDPRNVRCRHLSMTRRDQGASLRRETWRQMNHRRLWGSWPSS
eukprot:TRINITY_DN57931_c0_g1_i1.p1 TRINITY_DN57931_c0_g1~~TRINITY_DN57931_c0_g1_i1.p1  ORF type:complete len:100 (+),score=8.79 TRINITY_DN57931_c0_g1_i1:12-311(+)